jgi:8-oxo-dGTP pyrophosphatase MutT (NUDIX family)
MTKKKNTPPSLRDAATIILVRERHNALEVYLLRRSTQSKFMGGIFVFPGGVVEDEDRGIETWAPHIDVAAAQIENQLGGNRFSDEDALGFGIAAIRETLEEAGILIASSENKSQKDFDDIADYRLKKDLPNSWFQTKIIQENWTISFSNLGRWSHWITPELMKKRFDTRFFIVFMPEDQTCVTDNRETKDGIWLTPQKALEQNLDAQTPLSPPAIVTLTHLSAFTRLEAIKEEIKNRSWGDPIIPRVYPSPDGPIIIEPWDPLHGENGDIEIDTSNLSQKILPPGEPFSRIWCDKGVWKPIAPAFLNVILE